MRFRLFTLAFAGAAAALTATTSLVPGFSLAYSSPQLHIALDTATALISFLVAYLVYGRFRERKRLDDLMLASALALIASTSLVFSAVPHTVPAEGVRNFSVWASVGGAVLGALTLALAAFAPATRVSSPRRATVIAALCCLGALIATASVVGLFADGVDPEIPLALAPDAAHRPILLGHHFLLGTQIVGVLLCIAAALGFIQRGERALDESRRAIAALTRPVDEPLEVALVQAAEEVAGRVGVQLRIEVGRGAQVSPDEREALIRIVREAITNAGRHGGAENVSVELSNGNGTLLRIVDDGSGFNPRRTRVGGFGLVSMRERAEALGGRFKLSSNAGEGTRIEVRLP
jgi:signal transduction histidine kinase